MFEILSFFFLLEWPPDSLGLWLGRGGSDGERRGGGGVAAGVVAAV